MFKVKVNGIEYNFEKFSYIKSYNDYCKVVIDGLYTSSSVYINPSHHWGCGKGTELKVELIYELDAVTVEKKSITTINTANTHHTKKISNGVTTADDTKTEKSSKTSEVVKDEVISDHHKETLMTFDGILQSVSMQLKGPANGIGVKKPSWSFVVTSEFANMSNTANIVFDMSAKDEKERNLSKVVKDPMNKYLSNSSLVFGDDNNFPAAGTSTAIISESDTKNMAYGISKEYGFSIYDTQRAGKDADVEIKRIGHSKAPAAKQSYNLTEPNSNSNDPVLMLDAVRQIARNNVVYDGTSSVNPILYYKDWAMELSGKSDDSAVKMRGKAMYPIGIDKNPQDSQDQAQLTMSDPFEYSEDGKDAQKKVLGRKDYKIFERSEYEMTFTSVPAINVETMSDEEQRDIQNRIDELEEESVTNTSGYNENDARKVNFMSMGCAACIRKINKDCGAFVGKREQKVYKSKDKFYYKTLYDVSVEDLGPLAPFKIEEIEALSEKSPERLNMTLVNAMCIQIYDFLAKHMGDSVNWPERNRNLIAGTKRKFSILTDEQIDKIGEVMRIGVYRTEKWDCRKYCHMAKDVIPWRYESERPTEAQSNNPVYADNFRKEHRKGFWPENSYWSPFGNGCPSVAFCNNIKSEEACTINLGGCGIYGNSIKGTGMFNIFKHRGPREADLYAYLCNFPDVQRHVAFYYTPDDWAESGSNEKKQYTGSVPGDSESNIVSSWLDNYSANKGVYGTPINPNQFAKSQAAKVGRTITPTADAFGHWLLARARKDPRAGKGFLTIRNPMLRVINPITLKEEDSSELREIYADNPKYIEAVVTWLQNQTLEVGLTRLNGEDMKGGKVVRAGATGKNSPQFQRPAQTSKWGEDYKFPDGESDHNVFNLKNFSNLCSPPGKNPRGQDNNFGGTTTDPIRAPLIGDDWNGEWKKDEFYLFKGNYFTYDTKAQFPSGRRGVERLFVKDADHPFTDYKNGEYEEWSKYKNHDDNNRLVLFSHEKISPNAFDRLLSNTVLERNGIIKPVPSGVKDELKKLRERQKKGGIQSNMKIKIEGFFDKFPLDYISFKNVKDIGTVAPVEDSDYILKKIDTTITNSSEEVKKLQERMLKSVFGDKEIEHSADGRTWKLKGQDSGKAFISDFAGVTTTLTVAPATKGDRGDFVEDGAKMSIGDYEDE